MTKMPTSNIVVLTLLIAITCVAQGQRKDDPCERAKNSGVTVDLVECSKKELSAATFEFNFCLAEMTTSRTKELREMIGKINERDGDQKDE